MKVIKYKDITIETDEDIEIELEDNKISIKSKQTFSVTQPWWSQPWWYYTPIYDYGKENPNNPQVTYTFTTNKTAPSK